MHISWDPPGHVDGSSGFCKLSWYKGSEHLTFQLLIEDILDNFLSYHQMHVTRVYVFKTGAFLSSTLLTKPIWMLLLKPQVLAFLSPFKKWTCLGHMQPPLCAESVVSPVGSLGLWVWVTLTFKKPSIFCEPFLNAHCVQHCASARVSGDLGSCLSVAPVLWGKQTWMARHAHKTNELLCATW
jgi:hypothetical protein